MIARAGIPGTRFRLFAQSPFGAEHTELETVTISSPRGSVTEGPADARAYTIVPIGKQFPYGVSGGSWHLPPWRGPVQSLARPDQYGHFDYLQPGTMPFEAAHLFGAVRFVMDIWERYIGEPIAWHFSDTYDRIELAIIKDWPNAHVGFGYLEVGELRGPRAERIPYSLNFDIIAHEVGHALIMAMAGDPGAHRLDGELQAFHEASADFLALISALHFNSVRREVLQATGGNLDGFNRLSRFAEFSHTQQVRLASNALTMHDFAHGWGSEHELSKPLLGALFDTLIDIYHDLLVDHGFIPRALEELADDAQTRPALLPRVQRQFTRLYRQAPEGFEAVLVEARDIAAILLLDVWHSLGTRSGVFAFLGNLCQEVRSAGTQDVRLAITQSHFQARAVGSVRPGPRIRAPGPDCHGHSARFLTPGDAMRAAGPGRRRASLPETGL